MFCGVEMWDLLTSKWKKIGRFRNAYWKKHGRKVN